MLVNFRYFVFLVILLLNNGHESVTIDLPQVEMVAWLETDDYKWKYGNEMELQGISYNKTTFIIPSDIHGLIISCNASYPIEWIFIPDEHLDLSVMVFSLYTIPAREGDGSRQNPFLFIMKLLIYGDTNGFSGKYICKKTGEDNGVFGDLSSEIYIFWEGNSPPYLMGYGKTVKVSSYKKGSLRLPCAVSFPEIDVFLQKKINVTHKDNTTEIKFIDLEFNTNTSAYALITYDPTLGFIMDNTIDKNISIDGEYKCLTNEKDDVVTVIVTPEQIVVPVSNPEKDKLDRGASLAYNESTQQLVCCSSSNKAPNIYVFYCMSYAHCKIGLSLLYHSMIEKLKLYRYGHSTNENCASMYMYQGGAYRCLGDGIDVSRVIFSNWGLINGTYRRSIYWSWSDINTQEQQNLITMYVQVLHKPSTSLHLNPYWHYQNAVNSNTFYTGQNISFNCQPVMFYFSDGIIWKIKWKNNTETALIPPPSPYDNRFWFFMPPQSSYVIISTQIHSVNCFAPIWNSTDWVRKEYIITAKDPTKPTISSPDDTELYWTLNDTVKSIHCFGTGDPLPELRWLKNGKIVESSHNVDVNYGNASVSLTFHVAEYNVHGSYLCVAENILDKTEKMFNVYVEEGHPWVATVTITCIVLTFLTILAVLGWRIKINHDTASELRWRTS